MLFFRLRYPSPISLIYKRITLVFIFLSMLFFTSCGDHSKSIIQSDTSQESLSLNTVNTNNWDETSYNNCSANWVTSLSTNHLDSKAYSGDTHAAYALFAFKANRRNKYTFRIRGRTPNARFFSFESYEGPLMAKGHKLYDSHLLDQHQAYSASSSSYNGYQFIAHPPEDWQQNSANLWGYKKLAFSPSKIRPTIKTIMMRIYAPEEQGQITYNDLPSVYAFDPVSGRPKPCPPVHNFKPFEIPQQALTVWRGLRYKRNLEFNGPPPWFHRLGLGGNSAVKEYVMNTTRIDNFSDVSVIRFRAPISTSKFKVGQVRYWSFCLQNFARNTTIACLPDYMAEKDFGKMITVVHSRPNAAIERAAIDAGYYFIPDRRTMTNNPADLQRVVGFVYRNMMTDANFDYYAYQGDYKPKGKVCTFNEFLNPGLRNFKCF